MGMPKVVPPGLTAFHAAAVYLPLYGAATLVTSVSRPSAAKLARFIPSIFDRQGAVPAFTAARSFWYAVSPAGLTNLIWVSGCALFHTSVCASMPSVQLQNSRVTLPLVAFVGLAAEPESPPPAGGQQEGQGRRCGDRGEGSGTELGHRSST